MGAISLYQSCVRSPISPKLASSFGELISPVSLSTITEYAPTPTDLADIADAIFSADVPFEACRISPGTKPARFRLNGTTMNFSANDIGDPGFLNSVKLAESFDLIIQFAHPFQIPRAKRMIVGEALEFRYHKLTLILQQFKPTHRILLFFGAVADNRLKYQQCSDYVLAPSNFADIVCKIQCVPLIQMNSAGGTHCLKIRSTVIHWLEIARNGLLGYIGNHVLQCVLNR
jgi:hypothetical protein